MPRGRAEVHRRTGEPAAPRRLAWHQRLDAGAEPPPTLRSDTPYDATGTSEEPLGQRPAPLRQPPTRREGRTCCATGSPTARGQDDDWVQGGGAWHRLTGTCLNGARHDTATTTATMPWQSMRTTRLPRMDRGGKGAQRHQAGPYGRGSGGRGQRPKTSGRGRVASTFVMAQGWRTGYAGACREWPVYGGARCGKDVHPWQRLSDQRQPGGTI